MIIILLLIFECFANTCHEAGYSYAVPQKYHNQPFEITVKKDNNKIGEYPSDTITDVYQYGFYVNVSRPTMNMLSILFNPSEHDNSGHYEFILKSSTEEVLLGSTTFIADRTKPLRVSKVTTYAVTRFQDKYICSRHGQFTNKDVLWYMMKNGTFHFIHAKDNFIPQTQVNGFTKIYCDMFDMCETSDILYPNGTRQRLTWDTDFRPLSRIAPTTHRYKVVVVIDEQITQATSGVKAKSASLLMILLLIIEFFLLGTEQNKMYTITLLIALVVFDLCTAKTCTEPNCVDSC